jgi:hypothetical protein
VGKGDERTDLMYVNHSFSYVQHPVLTQVAHARVLYAEELTPTSVLDVISTQSTYDHPVVHTSCIIMTDTPRSTECKVLLSFTSSLSSLHYRLETLLKSEAGTGSSHE